MKKMIYALTLGMLAASFSAIQAKDQGLTTNARLKEAGKGTAYAAITAGNAYFLYKFGWDFGFTTPKQTVTELQGKTLTEGAWQVFGGLAFASAVAAVLWAGTKTAALSYESFKKALAKPTDEEEIKVVVQPRKK